MASVLLFFEYIYILVWGTGKDFFHVGTDGPDLVAVFAGEGDGGVQEGFGNALAAVGFFCPGLWRGFLGLTGRLLSCLFLLFV